MIKKFFFLLLFILVSSIAYLNYFGISTNKFNYKIEKKVKENYPSVNLKLNDVKILLNIFKFSVNLETESPSILLDNEEIRLEKLSTKYDLISLFNNKFIIRNLHLNTENNQIKKIIKLLRIYKDSPQMLIIDKIIKTGNVKIFAKLNFDKNGKLLEDEYKLTFNIENMSIKLFNREKIKKISAVLKYSQNNLIIKNFKSDYQGVKLFSENIFIKKKKNDYIVKGNINTTENNIPSSISSIILKNKNFKDIVLSSKSNFSFDISNKIKISNLKISSKVNLKEADYLLDSKTFKKYLPEIEDKISFLNHVIDIRYDKKILLKGLGNIQIGKKENEINYDLELNKNKIKYDLGIDLNQTLFQIDVINYSKKSNEVAKVKILGESTNLNYLVKKIILETKDSIFSLNNFDISKNFKITDFEKVNFDYLDNNQRKNDLIIKKVNENNYLVKGKSFNLSKLIDDILFSDANNTKKIFDNKNRFFEINFINNYIDKDHKILNLKGNFQIQGNDVYDLSLNSLFPNKESLSMSIKSKDNQKVTTFYSELAKPFVKKYKFIKGFEGGKLDFYSIKKNNVSNSQLKIYEFSLKELPALTKILTLASLQGIADILSGVGVGFDELEMSFKSKKDLMEIQELYAIGPAISILMEGYIQKDELISLRGTLVPATTINKFVGSIPILGNILVGKKTGEGVFGVSFKLKGPPKDIKTSVNPIKTLTPRFITRTLEKIKKTN